MEDAALRLSSTHLRRNKNKRKISPKTDWAIMCRIQQTGQKNSHLRLPGDGNLPNSASSILSRDCCSCGNQDCWPVWAHGWCCERGNLCTFLFGWRAQTVYASCSGRFYCREIRCFALWRTVVWQWFYFLAYHALLSFGRKGEPPTKVSPWCHEASA